MRNINILPAGLIFGLALMFGVLVITMNANYAQAGGGPNYCHDEAGNKKGSNRCSSNNDCDGARTCSGAGWCEGTSRSGRAACTPAKFYRQADRPEVYYQYTSDLSCRVQNESQMAAWGGFDKVQVVKKLNVAGRKTGDCGWPNGFYRRKSHPEVYRLSGKGIAPRIGPSACHVINETQMAAFGGFDKVMVVDDKSEIGRGRSAVTKCNNP